MATLNKGVVHNARAALGMSQEEFGIWLGQQLHREPFPRQRVASWESGNPNVCRAPRREVREACAFLAARRLAEEITKKYMSADEIAHAIVDGMK